MDKHTSWIIGILMVMVMALFVVGIVLASKNDTSENQPLATIQTTVTPSEPITEPVVVASTPEVPHIPTPESVQAIYMSAWVASTPSFRAKLIDIIDTTDVNSVIIDIKDATGRISFLIDDTVVTETGSPRDLIKNIDTLIQDLHSRNIYVIGRVSVFQDPYLTAKKPEWAIQSKSTGTPWKDKKGLSFLDPTNPEVWDYTIRIAKAAHAVGFDEINFDYIRFPSDGNISDISYPVASGNKADAIETFFKALHTSMKDQDIVTSADLFGMTTSNTDDLGIGQVLEKALPYFDFIAPMIYPSHYPKGFNGYPNPAEKPYEIVQFAMKKGIERAAVLGYGPEKFRPWIQDFDLGATYTADMVKVQIRALRELGITSYMSWDPANTYTKLAY